MPKDPLSEKAGAWETGSDLIGDVRSSVEHRCLDRSSCGTSDFGVRRVQAVGDHGGLQVSQIPCHNNGALEELT